LAWFAAIAMKTFIKSTLIRSIIPGQIAETVIQRAAGPPLPLTILLPDLQLPERMHSRAAVPVMQNRNKRNPVKSALPVRRKPAAAAMKTTMRGNTMLTGLPIVPGVILPKTGPFQDLITTKQDSRWMGNTFM
jgi:hypothetical protein